MASSKATTVKEYLDELPDDRRKALEAVRKVIKKNIGKGYKEDIHFGIVCFVVPLKIYPAGYGGNPKQPLFFVGLASQKNHMALYMAYFYSEPSEEKWFRSAWEKTGKKLDMGKGCVRFKTLEDLPLELIGKAVSRVPIKSFAANYDAVRSAMKKKRKS